jgi:single-stranded DNA-binding protein
MNQVALVGKITDDPELRYTQSGAALEGFTVAVSHRSKHYGEWQDVEVKPPHRASGQGTRPRHIILR